MNAIGAGAPMASSATTASGCGSAFALDCCDREAMSFLATTAGISGNDVRDLMVVAVEHRFGRVNRLPVTIEWRVSPRPNAESVMRQLPLWITHYNEVHPHKVRMSGKDRQSDAVSTTSDAWSTYPDSQRFPT